HRPLLRDNSLAKIEFCLPCQSFTVTNTTPSHIKQQRKISLGVRRTEMLDPGDLPTGLSNDLYRGRAGLRLHFPHEYRHKTSLEAPVSNHIPNPKRPRPGGWCNS